MLRARSRDEDRDRAFVGTESAPVRDVVMKETHDDHLAQHPYERLVVDVHPPQQWRALDPSRLHA
jgi:hypothetical protein